MLSVFASDSIRPESEPIDRDPGIITLAAALVRSARHAFAGATTGLRVYNQKANEAESFSASNAWPYDHRSK